MPRGKAGNLSGTINYFDDINKALGSLFIKFPDDSIPGDLTKMKYNIFKINGYLRIISIGVSFISFPVFSIFSICINFNKKNYFKFAKRIRRGLSI